MKRFAAVTLAALMLLTVFASAASAAAADEQLRSAVLCTMALISTTILDR